MKRKPIVRNPVAKAVRTIKVRIVKSKVKYSRKRIGGK